MSNVFPQGALLTLSGGVASQDVIAAMVRRLVDLGSAPCESECDLINAVLHRETLGTSAIGNGLAFPHARTSLVDRITGCFAWIEPGCDFAALDGEPTRCVWLTLSPMTQRFEHYELLDRLFCFVRDPVVHLWMEHPHSAERIWGYFIAKA